MIRQFLIITLCSLITIPSYSNDINDYVKNEFRSTIPLQAQSPFSNMIEFLQLSTNENGEAVMGIAYRVIESYKPITGIVIVKKDVNKFVLLKADFPDINIIKNGKNRRKVASILKPLKDISFDPDSGERAVDIVSGATRYGAESLNYFNYMARRVAIEINKYNNQ
tara:strand:+ start:71 stop:568 length:498 start_codon:yes stop_codon:yes gene_type:complete